MVSPYAEVAVQRGGEEQSHHSGSLFHGILFRGEEFSSLCFTLGVMVRDSLALGLEASFCPEVSEPRTAPCLCPSICPFGPPAARRAPRRAWLLPASMWPLISPCVPLALPRALGSRASVPGLLFSVSKLCPLRACRPPGPPCPSHLRVRCALGLPSRRPLVRCVAGARGGGVSPSPPPFPVLPAPSCPPS